MKVRLRNWRLLLLLCHRWMGIAFGMMFVVWVLSGVILLYFGLPHLHAGERLSRLPTLNAAEVNVSPADAVARVDDGGAFRIRLSMHGDRPVYRINTGRVFGRWTLVYADNGERVEPLSANEAVAWLSNYVPEAATSMSLIDEINGPDLFTHNPGIQNHMPMFRIALNDSAGTIYYVSAGSGEAVMKTDRMGRLLGLFGYQMHTLFFFRQKTWWSTVLQVLAWSGLVIAILGLTLGIQRFSLHARFRRRGKHYRTPYSGLLQWHHYAGLFFGVFLVTWTFSGLVSMSVIPGIVETLYSPAQINAGARSVQGEGPRLQLAEIAGSDIRSAAESFNTVFPISEIEIFSFAGEAYFLAYRKPGDTEVDEWVSRSAFDFIAPALNHEHRLLPAGGTRTEPLARLPEAVMDRAAGMAMPNATTVTSARPRGIESSAIAIFFISIPGFRLQA